MLSEIKKIKTKLDLCRRVNDPTIKFLRVYEINDPFAKRDMLRDLERDARGGRLSVVFLESK